MRTAVAVLLAGALVLAACGSSRGEVVAGAYDLGHIHDLVLDAEGRLVAASHTGLYRIEASDRAVLIGDEQHDLMSMAQLSDGVLIAGGHPNLLLDKYVAGDKPPFLGLVESTDGGESWEIIDLLGDADFHALVPRSEGLYAAGGGGLIWFQDLDGQWSQLGEVGARDLALHPDNSDRQVVASYDNEVWVSSDRAATWTLVEEAPALAEVEWLQPDELVGMDTVGTIWAADSPEGPWTEIATGPEEVETLFIGPAGSWWVAERGGIISRSDNQGGSWQQVYVRPVDQ